ncbi:peptide deformylase [bacterium]|nr:peptide deformylase [bacterium]
MKLFAKMFVLALCALILFSCASAPKNEGNGKADDGSMSAEELSYINDTERRHLLQNDVEKDNEILRKVSIPAKLGAEGYDVLEKFMLESLGTGVGIAAPQVGINRRVIMVKRFDKEEKPFEFFYNIEIKKTYGEKVVGWEGCLSIPAGFGQVERWQDIDIEYDAEADGKIVRKSENIKGFTAVIFQHETDHLNGVLFIDIKTADPLMTAEEYREMRMKEKAKKEAEEKKDE